VYGSVRTLCPTIHAAAVVFTHTTKLIAVHASAKRARLPLNIAHATPPALSTAASVTPAYLGTPIIRQRQFFT